MSRVQRISILLKSLDQPNILTQKTLTGDGDMKKKFVTLLVGMMFFSILSCSGGGGGSGDNPPGDTGKKGEGNITLFGSTATPGGHYDEINFAETVMLDVTDFLTQDKDHRVEVSYRTGSSGAFNAVERFNTADTIIHYLPEKSGFYHFRVYYLNEAFLCDGTIQVVNGNAAPVASLQIAPEIDNTDLSSLPEENKEENSYPIDLSSNEKMILDVSGSTDADSEELTFGLAVTGPDGSAITVEDLGNGKYAFASAQRGLYSIELDVDDGIVDLGRDTSMSKITRQIYLYDQGDINLFHRTMVVFKKDVGETYSVLTSVHDYYFYDRLLNAPSLGLYFAFYADNQELLFKAFYEMPLKDQAYFDAQAPHEDEGWDPVEEYNKYLDSLDTDYIGDFVTPVVKGRSLGNWKRKATVTKAQIDAIRRIDVMLVAESDEGDLHQGYILYNGSKNTIPQNNLGIKFEE